MVKKEQLHRMVDRLSPASLEKLNKFIELLNSVDNLPEEEAKQFIVEAIQEVRAKRKSKSDHS